MFFSPRNPATALGMYSKGYFISLGVVLTIVIILLILSKKMSHKNVRITIISLGVILWTTEFIKMAFTGIVYGIDAVEWIPLYFCSMEMYACILLLFNNNKIQTTALSFIFFGGIIGAIAFFCYPNACIPNYPLIHYMTLRTFFYHGVMLYIGFLIIITGYYKPSIKHFKEYTVFLFITFILAYAVNMIRNTNLMYISQPLDFALAKTIYNKLGFMYPFIFGIGELIGPFFISYGIYSLINNLKKKKEKGRKECLN